MGEVLDGKAVAKEVRADVKARVERWVAQSGIRPGLAAVLVGDDPASRVYVGTKEKACSEVGIVSRKHHLPASTAEEDLLDLIRDLNADSAIHGILVQLPLPEGLDPKRVIEAVSPEKDVDGLHPVNQGRLLAGEEGLRPCTPLGVLELIDRTGVDLRGRHAVVVGRSVLVGKPVAMLLLERHATVTMCHSRTADLAAEVGRGDVLVAAVGRPGLVRGDWVRPGSIVIDVGINRTDEGLRGDVGFEGALERAAFVTPVPGGVGPMTVAMLLRNTLLATERALDR